MQIRTTNILRETKFEMSSSNQCWSLLGYFAFRSFHLLLEAAFWSSFIQIAKDWVILTNSKVQFFCVRPRKNQHPQQGQSPKDVIFCWESFLLVGLRSFWRYSSVHNLSRKGCTYLTEEVASDHKTSLDLFRSWRSTIWSYQIAIDEDEKASIDYQP